MELFRSSSRKRRLEIFPFFFLLNTTAVFPPQIRGLTRGQGFVSSSFVSSRCFISLSRPTNDIFSIISIFSNYNLQLGRKGCFLTWDESFFSSINFFRHDEVHSCPWKKREKFLLLFFIHLRGGEKVDRFLIEKKTKGEGRNSRTNRIERVTNI